jgi:hypothetical protein
MSHKVQNQESCEVSPDGEVEQARTLLELVTEIYNALEKEKRLLARDHRRLPADSVGRHPAGAGP